MIRPAAYVLLLSVARLPAGAQVVQTPAPVPATVALVVTYVDGRTSYELVSPRPGSTWTPVFPRINGWQTPEGFLPVAAIQFSRVLVGQDVKVIVSVLLGQRHQQEVVVATALVRPGAHVIINELRKFGVQPVDLSLAAAAPFRPYLPTVVSDARDLEISFVDLLTAPYPGYRITVRNLSPKAAASFRVQSYSDDRPALSGIQRGVAGRPVLRPGDRRAMSSLRASATIPMRRSRLLQLPNRR